MKIVLIAVVLLCVVGCGENLIERHQNQLVQLHPGETSLDQFRELMPKANLSGQNTVSGKRVDAYAISDRIYDPSIDRFYKDELWFYFHDERLVKWGHPNDWPVESDFIIEVRDR